MRDVHKKFFLDYNRTSKSKLKDIINNSSPDGKSNDEEIIVLLIIMQLKMIRLKNNEQDKIAEANAYSDKQTKLVPYYIMRMEFLPHRDKECRNKSRLEE